MVIYPDDPNNDEESEFLTIGDPLDSPLLTFSLTIIALPNSLDALHQLKKIKDMPILYHLFFF
jgi:hypothetical protein